MVAGAIRVRGPPEDEALRQAMHKVRAEHARQQKHDYSHVFRFVCLAHTHTPTS